MLGFVVSVYVSLMGMGVSRRSKARRCSSVGSASLSMVTSVSPKVNHPGFDARFHVWEGGIYAKEV